MHNIQALTLGLGLGAANLVAAAPLGHVLIYRPPYLHGISLNHTSPNGTNFTTQQHRNDTHHHQQQNFYLEIHPSFDHLKNSTFILIDHKSRDERSMDPSNINLNSQLEVSVEKVIEARRDPGATWLCNFAAKVEPFWSYATGQGKHPVDTNRCLDSRQPHNSAKNEVMGKPISEERLVETQNVSDQVQQARNDKASHQLEARRRGFADWMKKPWQFATKWNRAVDRMDGTSQQLDQRDFQSWWNKNWRDW